MGKDLTTNREGLLRAATLVRPALADRAYIPALQHIMFDGEWATAFDDKLAIAVVCDATLNCLVPGVLFMQSLNSFGGKDVLVQSDDGGIVLKSGRSRVKLPTLPIKHFPLEWPDDEDAVIEVEGDMLKSIERCLLSVNSDATQPAQMGVTLDTDDDCAVFFSTDNSSVSRAQCTTRIKLPGDVPIIMPRPFCEQLLALNKAFPECLAILKVGPGWLEVQYEVRDDTHRLMARLFSRTLVDLDPLNFPKQIQRHCGNIDTLGKRATTIPDELDAALARALLVLASETRKRTTARVDDGVLTLHASSEFGDSDDSIKIDLDNVGPVPMDAFYVARALKYVSHIAITDTVTILVGGKHFEFVHMVAHVREMK